MGGARASRCLTRRPGTASLKFVRVTARHFLPAGTDTTTLAIVTAVSDTDPMARCYGVELRPPVGRRV